ncbi:VOC family protein [Mesorhizobium sp.]|uniref:VOC family protein n=1 Tax=Mesorhizobium sp. TaxID=1871066 RepID=UPI000FE520C9|nr:VOC family protein [Mesorhizobium sp.]RWD39842.1 MAG: VOC family protein [Mesorhizobium sp.]
MIDHVSLGVRCLDISTSFYELVLGSLGYTKLVVRPLTVGFGKRYAEVWINSRPQAKSVETDSGAHLCLRAGSPEQVEAFHHAALANGGVDDGAPGPREHDAADQTYYSAFVRDPDGNRIEAVCFVGAPSP